MFVYFLQRDIAASLYEQINSDVPTQISNRRGDEIYEEQDERE